MSFEMPKEHAELTGCSGNHQFGRASPGRTITPVHHGGPSAGRSPHPSPDGSPAADSPGGSSADRKSTRLNSSHSGESRMPSSA